MNVKDQNKFMQELKAEQFMNQMKTQDMENMDERKVFMHSSIMENQGMKMGKR